MWNGIRGEKRIARSGLALLAVVCCGVGFLSAASSPCLARLSGRVPQQKFVLWYGISLSISTAPAWSVNITPYRSNHVNICQEDTHEDYDSSVTELMRAAAVADPHPDKVKALLQKGAKVDVRDNKGQTALIWALHAPRLMAFTWRKENVEVVKALLKAGAKVNVTNEYGDTALMLLAKFCDLHLVKAVLDRGARINAAGQGGYTALFYAAECEDVTDLLIKRGAKVNAKAKEGNTPLSIVVSAGSFSVIKGLLNAGANINAMDNNGVSVLMSAVLRDSDTLQDHTGRATVIKLLLRKGANVYAKDKDGQTALHLCTAHQPHPDDASTALKLLLAAGANVNAQDKQGKTALMWAAEYSHKSDVQLLLAKGADVRIKDKDNRTALQMASDPAIVDMLKKADLRQKK